MRIPTVYEETYKRLNVAKKLKGKIHPCKAILLAGSVAYGENYCVTPESDLELICIVDKESILKNNFLDEIPKKYLSSGKAEMYKKGLPGYEFPVDLIFWTDSFFEKVCNNINFKSAKRFSEEDISKREDVSKRKTLLEGFHSHETIFPYKCEKTKGGFLIKYPVHLIKNDLYYFASAPIENLLSNPKVLVGDKDYVDRNIDLLWKMLVERMSCEIGGPDDNPFFENLLLRRNRMPPSFLDSLIEKENRIRNPKWNV